VCLQTWYCTACSNVNLTESTHCVFCSKKLLDDETSIKSESLAVTTDSSPIGLEFAKTQLRKSSTESNLLRGLSKIDDFETHPAFNVVNNLSAPVTLSLKKDQSVHAPIPDVDSKRTSGAEIDVGISPFTRISLGERNMVSSKALTVNTSSTEKDARVSSSHRMNINHVPLSSDPVTTPENAKRTLSIDPINNPEKSNRLSMVNRGSMSDRNILGGSSLPVAVSNITGSLDKSNRISLFTASGVSERNILDKGSHPPVTIEGVQSRIDRESGNSSVSSPERKRLFEFKRSSVSERLLKVEDFPTVPDEYAWKCSYCKAELENEVVCRKCAKTWYCVPCKCLNSIDQSKCIFCGKSENVMSSSYSSNMKHRDHTDGKVLHDELNKVSIEPNLRQGFTEFGLLDMSVNICKQLGVFSVNDMQFVTPEMVESLKLLAVPAAKLLRLIERCSYNSLKESIIEIFPPGFYFDYPTIPFNELDVENVFIGSGAFAHVHKGYWNGRTVVIKRPKEKIYSLKNHLTVFFCV
jgi:hypothetical protein